MTEAKIELPKDFIERVTNDCYLGSVVLDALELISPVSIRLNPLKCLPDLELQKRIIWCDQAWYLANRPNYTLDPLFHAGCYYPQEAGSMTLDLVLRSLDLPSDPVILDLCAAPGGKSTLITSYLHGRGMLVANEIIAPRASILRENLSKWGADNTIVTNNSPKDFNRLPHFFDVIIIDAPCSGEGMFRKDHQSRTEWSEKNVVNCASRQKEILQDSWETLIPGGYLIYSTCTLNRIENEDIMLWAMETFGAIPEKLNMPETISPDRIDLGWYCIPGISESEGFYICVLKKPTEELMVRRKNRSSLKKLNASKEILELVKDEKMIFYQRDEWIYGINQTHEERMLFVQSVMKVLKFGVAIGQIAKKGIIPSEELALSADLMSDEIATIELTRLEALKYLKGETFPKSGKDGWTIATYKGQGLGWIKQIGHRFNNNYPKEWRIRMKIAE
ncbi:MAG: hypothetical protein LW688_12725 [Cryomorphaceae bacterium]|nr:hypothetical protein [Cryomorphaceae bacterium]